MIHHQKILGAVAVTGYGPRTGDIQKLDPHAARGSRAVLLEGALRVRQPDDGAEGSARLAKYSMPQVGWNILSDAKLRSNTTRRFRMLGPSNVTADWLHMADSKVHHLIENLRVIEFGIFDEMVTFIVGHMKPICGHMADSKVHHLIENLRVIEFGIFAIQFWCHKVAFPPHMQLQRRLAAWRSRCGYRLRDRSTGRSTRIADRSRLRQYDTVTVPQSEADAAPCLRGDSFIIAHLPLG